MSLAILGSASVAAGCSREAWLAKQTNGNACIIELVGTPAADVAVMRKTGFAEAIAKPPDMKIIASQSGDFTRAKGKAVRRCSQPTRARSTPSTLTTTTWRSGRFRRSWRQG